MRTTLLETFSSMQSGTGILEAVTDEGDGGVNALQKALVSMPTMTKHPLSSASFVDYRVTDFFRIHR